MGKLVINHNKITPEKADFLVNLCPFGAIFYENSKLDISSACKMCKMCVKKGEGAALTTMWTILGFPPASVAVPLWVKDGDKLPVQVVNDSKTHLSPLCERVVKLKKSVFSYDQGGGTSMYFNWEKLYNLQGTGIMQVLEPVEDYVFEIATPVIENWRKKGSIDTKEMQTLYGQIDAVIVEKYKELFDM